MTPDQESRLLWWYARNARELPWRRSRELYPVLVSELMLQQTTVAAVVPLYLRWMERFPSMASLARASSDEVVQAWSGLGYYSRARRLHETARRVLQSGREPASLEELLELPGLGPYTAAAVASIALRLPHLALDTNALRVLLRLYGWEIRADTAGVADRLRQRVEGGLGSTDFGITNQAIMELGATLCRVRAPACLACPLLTDCKARALAMEERIPVPKPRKAPQVTPATAYILCGNRPTEVILVRGTSLGLLGDLFQPPIDFHGANRAGSPLTPMLEWLRRYQGPTAAKGALGYGISGRRLTLSVKETGSLEAELMEKARKWGIDAVVWSSGQELALSSLTRKILKVWEGSRATPQPQDGRY